MENKVRRYLRVFPWCHSLSMDLLFWVAIDTLFLSVAKQLTDAQIVMVSSISLWSSILLQYPILMLIRRLGNTWSYRVGTLCWLSSALILTFSKGFGMMVLGRTICQCAYTFVAMSNVILQNNLELVKQEEKYMGYRTSATTIYSVITMVIALIAGVLFNISPYLPMVCSITLCCISAACSFLMRDYSPYNRVLKKKTTQKGRFSGYSKYVWLLMLAYALGGALMSNVQQEGKLFTQQMLLFEFDVEKTAYLLSGMVLVSRIARVIANAVFMPIYRKLKKQMGVFLNGTLLFALLLMIGGFLLPVPTIFRFLVMALGYAINLFLFDAYTNYSQTLFLSVTPHEQHQSIIANMVLGRKIANAMVSMGIAAALSVIPMVWAMIGMAVLAGIQVVFNIYLMRIVPAEKAQQV